MLKGQDLRKGGGDLISVCVWVSLQLHCLLLLFVLVFFLLLLHSPVDCGLACLLRWRSHFLSSFATLENAFYLQMCEKNRVRWEEKEGWRGGDLSVGIALVGCNMPILFSIPEVLVWFVHQVYYGWLFHFNLMLEKFRKQRFKPSQRRQSICHCGGGTKSIDADHGVEFYACHVLKNDYRKGLCSRDIPTIHGGTSEGDWSLFNISFWAKEGAIVRSQCATSKLSIAECDGEILLSVKDKHGICRSGIMLVI